MKKANETFDELKSTLTSFAVGPDSWERDKRKNFGGSGNHAVSLGSDSGMMGDDNQLNVVGPSHRKI